MASCTERWAPVYFGAQLDSVDRADARERFLTGVTALWESSTAVDVIGEVLQRVDALPELAGHEDEPLDHRLDVFSFFPVLVLRSALHYRRTSEVAHALECARDAATAVHQPQDATIGRARVEVLFGVDQARLSASRALS